MFRIILLCLLTCCSSFMPLKQSESIVSEDHTQVVEKKTKENYFSGQDGVNFVSSDFLSYDFGRIFYDYIKDFESPRTENLSYNRSYNPINYEFISDSPIGHLHKGGFSENLIDINSFTNGYGNTISVSGNNVSVTGAWYYFTPSYTLAKNTTYTISVGGMSGSGVLNIVAYNNTSQDHYFGELNSNNGFVYTFNSGNYDSLVLKLYSSGSGSTATSTYSNLMLNVGEYHGYVAYFTGVVQYASLPCYSFTLDKTFVYNSQYNGYCYHYVLKFYSRNPNGRPLLFGVDSFVIPHLKWEDSQGNLYGDNFYVVSNMIFNESLDYNMNNLVYSERSDDSYKPLLNCYVNNFNKEFSDDEYTLAYNTGYDEGYNNGNNYGYQRGYSQGVSDTIAGNSQAMTIFAGIMDVAFIPVNVFFLMFDYEVFGINIAGFVSGLITIAIVIILMRFIFGRKV